MFVWWERLGQEGAGVCWGSYRKKQYILADYFTMFHSGLFFVIFVGGSFLFCIDLLSFHQDITWREVHFLKYV